MGKEQEYGCRFYNGIRDPFFWGSILDLRCVFIVETAVHMYNKIYIHTRSYSIIIKQYYM